MCIRDREIGAHEENGERRLQRDIGDVQRDVGVAQAGSGEHVIQRDNDAVFRHHQPAEDGIENHFPEAPVALLVGS